MDNVRNYPAAVRAIERGASPDDMVRSMRAVSYEVVFRLLFLLSAEHVEEGNADATIGWVLAEADLLASGAAVPNGNGSLDFLHESLLGADPTGSEAEDLFT